MHLNKSLGAILLISCTAIGGGILALPIATFQAGFIPSSIAMLICWIFMLIAACFILEATLWYQIETNIISMAQDNLGSFGKNLSCLAYGALLYALISAYLMAISGWIAHLFPLSKTSSILCTSAIFAWIIFKGTKWVDIANRAFAIGLLLSYLIFVGSSYTHLGGKFIHKINFSATLPSLPLLITAFGFAIVVPTIVNYLNFSAKKSLNSILIGSFIPLLVYLVWQFCIFSILDIEGPYGLEQLAANSADGTTLAHALSNTLSQAYVKTTIKFFSIFAILTSMLGVSISLFDFLADGIKFKLKKPNKLYLISLVFLPATIIVIYLPSSFTSILSFSGIFVALLLGIIPALIILYGRKKHPVSILKLPYESFMAKSSIIFFSAIIIIEVINLVRA